MWAVSTKPWSKLTGGLEMWASMHAERSCSQDGQIPSSVLYAPMPGGAAPCEWPEATCAQHRRLRRQHDSRLHELSFASTHHVCSGKHAPRHLAWPALLQKELQQHLPSCRVLVHNRATPANRVTSLLSGFKLRKLISTEDAVVITDFTINDNKGLKHLPSRELINTAMGIAAAMEGLVRHVRGSSPGRQGPPALIQLESTRWPVVSGQHIGGLNLTSNWACVPATSNSSEDPHLGVTRHYGVPVISFVHGAA